MSGTRAGESCAGITVPEGDPAGLRAAAQHYAGAAGTLGAASASLQGMPGLAGGWQGPASVCYAGTCHRNAAAASTASQAMHHARHTALHYATELEDAQKDAALSRLVALGPRPRPDAPVRLDLAGADLARLLATRERPGRLGHDAAEGAAIDAIANGPTSHWRIVSRFGADGGRAVEVVDTPAGLWLVRPDGDRVHLWPATPTTVFTALVELLPDDDELS